MFFPSNLPINYGLYIKNVCGKCKSVLGHYEPRYKISYHDIFCEKCFKENVIKCPFCNELIVKNKKCYCCGAKNGIHSYGYKPKPKFHGYLEPFFGIELEVARKISEEKIDDLASQQASKIRGWAYLKHDTSLETEKYDGFEIVTHPLSIEWINNNRFVFDDIFELANKGFVAEKSKVCGMHVHVSKDYLFEDELRRLLHFFYGSRENKKFIRIISGRTRSNFEKWSPLCKHTDVFLDILSGRKWNNDYPREAISFGLPVRKTIEFRLFNSTLNKQRFFGNIEFIQAVLDFSKYKTKNLEDVTVLNFMNFVLQEKEKFPNLNMYIDQIYRKLRITMVIPNFLEAIKT